MISLLGVHCSQMKVLVSGKLKMSVRWEKLA